MKKTRLLILCLCVLFLLSGCKSDPEIRTTSYYDLFDTYISFTTYDLDEAEFNSVSEELYTLLQDFHHQTDIYHHYDGMTNLYDMNAAAGGNPLTVSETLMDFLNFCIEADTVSNHKVNVMLGSVTSLWHEARETGTLPSQESLNAAAELTDIHFLKINSQDNTAVITMPGASLDVGALAKGYAGKLAVNFLRDSGIDNFVLNLGGNVCAYGQPVGTGRDRFTIGIQDPRAADGTYKTTCSVKDACAVTSGDYQRFIEVDGVRYHHIIDPDTLQPSAYHHSVTVICEDSAMADLLSTALFLMPEEEGTALAESYGAEVIYLD